MNFKLPLRKLYDLWRKGTFTRLYERCESGVKLLNQLYADLRNFN